MANILITGGSGLIGNKLTHELLAHGHSVRWLSRSAGKAGGVTRFVWDLAKSTVDERALEGVDSIIHLSGAGIADKRWTPARLKELYASRSGAARLLLKVAKANGLWPKSFISASGVGFYGAITSERIFVESDPAGNDTIGRLSADWENAADEWNPNARVVKLRTPVVLACEGGALPKLSAPIRLGLGSALGSGKQWMPWIHIDDLVQAYRTAVEDERMSGAYNVVAPEQPTNAQFMRAVANVLRKPFFLPNVPAFALHLALGELSDVLLKGSRASNEKLVLSGFRLKYPALSEALRSALA
ncbi:MAG: TIGR01777 family protein [Flavobacteriales bacterium]|nr:TIGR01777 family protein [Flavobacteriales bacterium]